MLRRKLKLASDTNSGDDTSKPKKLKKSSQTAIITSSPHFKMPLWQRVYNIECRLSAELKELNFLSTKVAAVYNPVEYAAELHCAYLQKFLTGTKSVLFIGMNPGPWGMVQTGVPFGYIPAVRDWLKLEGVVNKPEKELPSRPVTGLQCDKGEVSGQRFWGLLQHLSGDTPDKFFRNCFVQNLCPLAFFHSSGRNVTPAELQPNLKKPLQSICNKHMKEIIDLIEPEVIVSIGRYCEDRVNELVKGEQINGSISHKCIPHPSPRSLNNTNWNEKAEKWLIDNDVMKFIK